MTTTKGPPGDDAAGGGTPLPATGPSVAAATQQPNSVSLARQRREAWLRPGLAAARQHGVIPSYGSSEWLELADSDPRKVAAAVVAGECWLRDGETLPQRLEDELRARREWEDAEDARLGAYMARVASRPTFTELQRRRGMPLGKGPRYAAYLRWRDDELRRAA